MKNKIKILSCFLLVFIVLLGLCACGNKKNNDDEKPMKQATVTTPKYTAYAYLLDNWRTDFEDGSRKYTYPILLYSKDYCATITEDNILYTTDGGDGHLKEKEPSANIEFIDFNNPEQCQTLTLAIITTDKILDTQKIIVEIFGFKNYIGDFYTQEAYIDAGGTNENWCAITAFLSTSQPPFHELLTQARNDADSLIQLYDEQNSLLFIHRSSELTITTDRIVREFNVKELTSYSTIDSISTDPISYYASNDPTENTYVELNDNIEIVCEVSENSVLYGFKTVDGSSIEQYKDTLPRYIVDELNSLNIWDINP